MLCIFEEVLDPFEAWFVAGPSIIANIDSLGYWNANVIPGGQVKLAVKNDEWRDCRSFRIDCLDRSNPLPALRLCNPWSALPI